MSTDAKPKVRIGELLVEAGVLSQEKLDEALGVQRETGTRLGTVLIGRGYVTEPQLVQALSRQLSIPWVSLWHLDISEQLLDMVPEEIVIDSGVLPIYVRTLRDGGRALYVAMDNPADTDLIEKIGAACGMAVKPMIAGPSEIAGAIQAYYGRRWRGAPVPAGGERRVSSVPPAATPPRTPPSAPPRKPPSAPPTPPKAKERREPPPTVSVVVPQGIAEAGAMPGAAAAQPAADDKDAILLQEEAGEAEGAIVLTETVDDHAAGAAAEPEAEAGRPAEGPAEGPGEGPGEAAEDEGPRQETPSVVDLFAPRPEEAVAIQSTKKRRFKPGAFNLTLLDGTSIALGGSGMKKPPRSGEEMLEFLDTIDLKGGGGKKMALALKGILKTLMRRGLLTEAEIADLLEGK